MGERKAGTSRRDLLKLGAASVPAAVAAAATGTASAAVAPAETSSGLRQTEHTRKYWESARF